MEIKIIGEHLEITPSMDDYIKNKFVSLHTPDKLIVAEFRVGQEKNTFKVNFTSNFNHKSHFLESKGKTFYEASDLLIEKIKRALNPAGKPKRTQSLKRILTDDEIKQ